MQRDPYLAATQRVVGRIVGAPKIVGILAGDIFLPCLKGETAFGS